MAYVVLLHTAVPFLPCAGDNRSFVMMNICANRLAGEKRKGWAAANVVAEMCEALVGYESLSFPVFCHGSTRLCARTRNWCCVTTWYLPCLLMQTWRATHHNLQVIHICFPASIHTFVVGVEEVFVEVSCSLRSWSHWFYFSFLVDTPSALPRPYLLSCFFVLFQVSMLHHQLHEVVMKALDPRRYACCMA